MRFLDTFYWYACSLKAQQIARNRRAGENEPRW